MKQTVFFFLIFLVISCKNESYNYKEEAVEDVKIYHEAEVSSLDKPEVIESQTDLLIIPKLEEYFELIKLYKQHPEFEEDIIKQLRSLSEDEILKLNYPDSFSIQNIRIENIEKVLDSVQTAAIFYDVNFNNGKKTDTILATITKQVITLEGTETYSSKITFKNNP